MGELSDNNVGLYKLRAMMKYETKLAHHLMGDSIANETDNGYGYMLPYIIEQIAGAYPTRIVTHTGQTNRHGCNFNDRTATGVNEFGSTTGIGSVPYKTTGGGYASLSTGLGCELPHNGTISYSTDNGVDGSAFRLTVGNLPAFVDPTNGHASAVEYMQGVMPDADNSDGLDNRVGVSFFVFDDGSGLPDRDFEFYNGRLNQTLALTLNPSEDIRGYLNLDETHTSNRGAAIEGMVGRLPQYAVTEHITASTRLWTYIGDKERRTTGSNAAINDGSNLVFVGSEVMRLNASNEWVEGQSFIQHFGGSWDLDDLATSSTPNDSEPKRFTDSQLAHAVSAWTWDTDERSVYWLCLAQDGLSSVEDIKQAVIDYMDRIEAAEAACGKPLPFFVNVIWHREGTQSQATQEARYEGYKQATQTRANACCLNMPGILDYTVWDGSQTAQDYLSDTLEIATVTFGGLSSEDISGGNFVNDGTHQTDWASNAFLASQLNDNLLVAQADIFDLDEWEQSSSWTATHRLHFREVESLCGWMFDNWTSNPSILRDCLVTTLFEKHTDLHEGDSETEPQGVNYSLLSDAEQSAVDAIMTSYENVYLQDGDVALSSTLVAINSAQREAVS